MDEPAPLPEPPAGEVTLEEALAYAAKLHQGGKLGAAEEVYRRVLAVAPEQPDALHFTGLLAFQRGNPEEAVTLIGRALAVNPAHADAHNNLGNVLQHMKRHEEAVHAYERAITLRPDFVDAFYNQGTALESLGRLDDSLTAFRRAILLTPFHVDSYRRMGAVLYASGRVAEAAEVYTKWVSIQPDSDMARHMLASCTGEAVPPRTSDATVKDIFDRFAESFDEVLTKLHYRAPSLIAHTIEGLLGPGGEQKLDVVDLGCGTGLCGPLLRPYARRLVGVDLSAPMLTKAEARKTYDELVNAELTAFLAGGPASTWDVMASADTLVYFGDLGPFLAAAKRALRPDGLLAFTVERAEQGDGDGDDGGGDGEASDGYRITPSGRYVHTDAYLRSAVLAAGLELRMVGHVHLRVEMSKPVDGFVVVARRSTS